MAQGQALSVFSRAYRRTREERFLKAGERALEFLLRPVAEGGVMTTLADLDPALRDSVIFEEYVAEPRRTR